MLFNENFFAFKEISDFAIPIGQNSSVGINSPCFSMGIFQILQLPMLFSRNLFILISNPQLPHIKVTIKHVRMLTSQIETKSPCVLQDFVPFGTAALLTIINNNQYTKQGNGYHSPHTALGRLFFSSKN